MTNFERDPRHSRPVHLALASALALTACGSGGGTPKEQGDPPVDDDRDPSSWSTDDDTDEPKGEPPPDDQVLDCENGRVELTAWDLAGRKTRLRAGDCYDVVGAGSMRSGALLIDPGVTLTFDADAGLEIADDASFTAVGSVDAPIVFRAREPGRGAYRGLLFTGSSSDENRIEHAVIEHAGAPWGFAYVSAAAIGAQGGTHLAVSDTTIRSSGSDGIAATGGVQLDVARVRFESNRGSMTLHPEVASGIARDVTFDGNDDDRVWLWPQYADEALTRDATWPALAVPYYVPDLFEVHADLTIEAGAHIELAKGAGLIVSGDGSLHAEGTAEAMITFRPGEGDQPWAGIQFFGSGSPNNVLAHVLIDHAGGWEWKLVFCDRSAVCLEEDEDWAQLVIRDSVISRSVAYGLQELGGDVTVTNTRFEGNVEPVSISADNLSRFDVANAFVDNGNQYVHVNTGASIDLTWPRLAVPYRVTEGLDFDGVTTIEPGVTIELEPDGFLRFDGRVFANGTAEAPISMRGVEHYPGAWSGVEVNADRSELHHVVIEDATGNDAALEIRAERGVVIDHLTVRNSESPGVAADYDRAVTSCVGFVSENNGGPDEGMELCS